MLRKYYNTVIIVENNDSTLVRDSNGNWVSSGGSKTEYKLYLKTPQEWSRRMLHKQETTDGQAQFMEGYIVEPKVLPDYITLPKRFKAHRQLADGQWQDCEFECRARIVPVPKTQRYTGQAIEGFIRWTK